MKRDGTVITQTPFRLSFFGGGTDLPEYFNEYEGAVLSTTIDKYLYVTINSLKRFYENRIRLSYSKLELVDNLGDLQHGIVKTVLKNHPSFSDDSFIDMHTYADFPAASGMGSSSAFTVGFLNALYSINGIYKTPEEIAYEAINVEREKLKEIGGWQDQIASSQGGLNLIRFKKNSFFIEPISLSFEKIQALEDSFLLFFTGGTRSSAEIQKGTFGVADDNKTVQLHAIKQSVFEALAILRQSNTISEMVNEFGALLHKSWEIKRSLSACISNSKINAMYDAAIKAGALGGKLCGAGGGGFLLLVVPFKFKEKVISALNGYKYVNIKFDDMGARVIYSKIAL